MLQNALDILRKEGKEILSAFPATTKPRKHGWQPAGKRDICFLPVRWKAGS